MSRSLEANRHSSDERNRTGVTEFRSSPQRQTGKGNRRGHAEKLLSTDWKRNVTDGRTRVASRTIRGKAVAFAGGGLSDARLGSRRTTPFKRPGYDSADPAQMALRISEHG